MDVIIPVDNNIIPANNNTIPVNNNIIKVKKGKKGSIIWCMGLIFVNAFIIYLIVKKTT